MRVAQQLYEGVLIDGETVNRQTDWFELHDARLNLRPYTHPRPDIRVASIVSPSGPRAAGRFGVGLLSMGATPASPLTRPADFSCRSCASCASLASISR